MSFLQFLQGIGDRLGILEAAAAPDAKPIAGIRTRTVSLRDLTSEIKSGAVHSLADSPEELSMPFEKVFEAAGISPGPEDWTVERLNHVVTSDTMKNRSREEIRKSVLDMLKSGEVPAENIVRDAVARDQALDSFESFVGRKMESRAEAHRRRIFEAESRIRSLREECADFERALKADEEKWSDWRRRKREKEREWASTIGYIVDHRVITSDDEQSA